MEENHAKNQAEAKLSSIKEMLPALKKASDNNQEIEEDALEAGILHQYYILLCTGGPAVRITGELDEYEEPYNARLQYRDWGTPWTDLAISQEDTDSLLEYASHYQFEQAN